MTRTKTARARAGFTLVELLIVMAIIAILVALTTAGIFAMLNRGPETMARQEIAQLAVAIEACKNKLNPEGPLPYLPSKLVLREDCNYDMTDTTPGGQADTAAFLQKAFGRDCPVTTAQLAASGFTYIDWNGNISGVADPPVTLEGEECLVFWLGGIPTISASGTLGCQGFKTDPRNPAGNGMGIFRAPYYTFPPARLAKRTPASTFWVYLDPFGSGHPFAYFSSGKATNDYNSDCAGLGVAPYYSSAGPPVKYINPNGYQIISAGKDGVFGPGGLWNGYGPTVPGSDDLANFSSTILASPPN